MDALAVEFLKIATDAGVPLGVLLVVVVLFMQHVRSEKKTAPSDPLQAVRKDVQSLRDRVSYIEGVLGVKAD